MVLENFRRVDETEREERFLHCSTKNKYAELKKKKKSISNLKMEVFQQLKESSENTCKT